MTTPREASAVCELALAARAMSELPELAMEQARQFTARAAAAACVVQHGANGTQVSALRWMFPDGRTPVILMPTSVKDAEFLASAAVMLALEAGLPSVFAVEGDLLAELKAPPQAVTLASAHRFQKLDTSSNGPDAEVQRWESIVRGNADALALAQRDLQPAGDGKVDWLVISYGLTARAARGAVEAARQKGIGVDHLVLHTLSPLPERLIASAAMGRRYVVVAERNLGQVHREIQRLCPSHAVVLVSALSRPVESEAVLGALLKFPRCC